MREWPDRSDRRKKLGNWLKIFVITLFFLGLLTTIQMLILGQYIKYQNISKEHITAIVIFWILCAVLFTLITTRQINLWYDRPIRDFANATKAVANGDFSVYVETIHSADKLDYLDYMFMDFNKMVEELGSIETLKTDFISNVSHEIKTPIAIIQNYAEYLQKDNLTEEERREYAGIIQNTTRRLSELITNILKMNKLENQSIQPAGALYDLSRQLTDCVILFEEIWEKKQIDFEADIEDKAMILADEALLVLVWNNLLSNAIKFTEPGGHILLRQIKEGNNYIVTVSDNGCGMTAEAKKHIFDKFYQGDTSHAVEGNGLGLALALRVLQLHDATIKVESEPGKGSAFTVIIPANIEMMK